MRIMVRLRAPPPQMIQLFGTFGSSGTIRAIAAAVKAVSVAAPSAGATSPSFNAAKSLRSSDFGGGSAKNGSSSARATQARSAVPCAAIRPSVSKGWPVVRIHEVVEQRVAGTGVAGDQRHVAVDIGDVGDAADIGHDDRPVPLQRLRQRAVIDRNEGRALPAGFDIGGAEIMHHGNMDRLGQRRGIADLHRQPPLGPVQHGLAVEADDVDLLAGDAVLRGEGGDRFRMRHGDGALGLAQHARPRLALRRGSTASVSAWRSRPRSLSV